MIRFDSTSINLLIICSFSEIVNSGRRARIGSGGPGCVGKLLTLVKINKGDRPIVLVKHLHKAAGGSAAKMHFPRPFSLYGIWSKTGRAWLLRPVSQYGHIQVAPAVKGSCNVEMKFFRLLAWLGEE